jgi:hypothetical protein
LRTESENTAVVVGHMEISSGKTFLIAVHIINTRTLMATIKEWILPRDDSN